MQMKSILIALILMALIVGFGSNNSDDKLYLTGISRGLTQYPVDSLQTENNDWEDVHYLRWYKIQDSAPIRDYTSLMLDSVTKGLYVDTNKVIYAIGLSRGGHDPTAKAFHTSELLNSPAPFDNIDTSFKPTEVNPIYTIWPSADSRSSSRNYDGLSGLLIIVLLMFLLIKKSK